jgi:hypothetical protein
MCHGVAFTQWNNHALKVFGEAMMTLPYRNRVGSLAACIAILMITGCGPARIPDRNPIGDQFPQVSGEFLTGSKATLPDQFLGSPAMYLVGYTQQTQFDLDRWTMGLLEADLSSTIVEIPTIPGLLPTAVSGWIDDGMRSGIPKEDWPAVITLYGSDAQEVAALTGTENPRNTRVLLIDHAGVVRWFWDQGFSASRLIELKSVIDKLPKQESK